MLNEPVLSVILPTDTYATIRPVIDRLRRQTVHDQIEVVLVAPSAEAVRGLEAHSADFAGIRIVEAPSHGPCVRPGGGNPRRDSALRISWRDAFLSASRSRGGPHREAFRIMAGVYTGVLQRQSQRPVEPGRVSFRLWALDGGAAGRRNPGGALLQRSV